MTKDCNIFHNNIIINLEKIHFKDGFKSNPIISKV